MDQQPLIGGNQDSSASSETAYRDRINNLTSKLSTLHEGIDKDRNSRYDHLQNKMKHLDERLSASQDASAKKFGVLKDHMLIFQQSLKAEQENRDAFQLRKEDEIVQIDVALQATLVAEQDARREAEQKIIRVFEEKNAYLKDEILNCGKSRLDSEAKLRRFLEVDIPKLYEGLKEEVENREAMEHRMLKKAMDEVTQLQGAVLAEKKAREDTEEAIIRMMEDVVTKMNVEIQNERRERERAEQMLLTLLNDTCNKLQVASMPVPGS